MKVDYLFSKSNKIGSKIISWGSKYENLQLNDIPSHMAVLLNNRVVVESTLFTGVRIIPYFKWKEINIEVAKIPCDKGCRSSKEVFQALISVWGMKYDWMGILFFAKCLLAMIIFKSELPEKNKWENKNKYFCTEYAARLTGQNLSMKTPARVLSEWTTYKKEK